MGRRLILAYLVTITAARFARGDGASHVVDDSSVGRSIEGAGVSASVGERAMASTARREEAEASSSAGRDDEEDVRKEALDRLNRCEDAALDAVPGLGPVLTQRVLSKRDESGVGFASWEAVEAVPGIGPERRARIEAVFAKSRPGVDRVETGSAPGEVARGLEGVAGRKAMPAISGAVVPSEAGETGRAVVSRRVAAVVGKPVVFGARRALALARRAGRGETTRVFRAARSEGTRKRAAVTGEQAGKEHGSGTSRVEVALAALMRERPGAGRVDLNAASAAEIAGLPGVGAAMARAIVEERERGGRFELVEDLLVVPGVSPGVVEGMRRYVALW